MSKLGPLLFTPVLAAVSSCTPGPVDYDGLLSHAADRERQAGLGAATPNRDVRALLAKPLTAETAARIAVLNNPGLRAAVEEIAIAEAELAGTRRLPNPTLEAALRFGGEGDPEAELGAMLDLTELILALPRGSAASKRLAAARLNALGAILDVSFEARRAFFEYQAALQQLELRTTVAEALGAAAEAAKQLREAGNITDLDLATQLSSFEQARLDVQRAETAVGSARERLNALLGVFGAGASWSAESRLPELPASELSIENLEREAVARSLDLGLSERRYAAAAQRADIESAAGWLPELKAGVSAERDESWSVGPAVELEVPLFYQGQGEVAAARAELRRERNLHEHTALRIRSRARELATRLSAARDAVIHYRDVILPLKQRILEQAQLQYNAMSIGVFQLLQAKREQVEAASAYIDRLREYWTLRTSAQQLLAGRLGPESPLPASGPMLAPSTAAEDAH